jgi:predicted GNAT family N-acyltransferase
MVQRLSLEQIMPLRVRVLRKGTPATHAHYPEDEYDDVVHFGIVHDGAVIATSTWFTKECPERVGANAMQLKGMAVDNALQTSGLGRQLIHAGIQLAQHKNAQVVWARARDTAVGFYKKCGFTVVGDGFIDEPTGMPHHIVVLDITNL